MGFHVAVTIALTLALLCGASYTGACTAGINRSENTPVSIKKQPDTSETAYNQEYEIWGIHEKDGIYYYLNERIRILMDLRADDSFIHSNYDELGTVDLKLLRGREGWIKKVAYLTQAETDEILKDLDIAPDAMPTEDFSEGTSRLTKDDIPVEILDLVDSCDTGKWYVIQGNKYQYIYYNSAPHNYAWQPEYDKDKISINIFDIGKSTGTYVLLAVPKHLKLTVSYHSEQVAYTTLGEHRNVNT